MELKMQPVQRPAEILFNFDELKQELTQRCEVYETAVYTEKEISNAKNDLAQLNALKKRLNDERLRQQREYMQPFDKFKAQIDELIGIADRAGKNIDGQLKAFDEARKQEKTAEIKKAFAEAGFPDFVKLELIWDKRWLNKTFSLSKVEAAMTDIKQQIVKDIETLQGLPEFAFEAQEAYKENLNMNAAIAAGQRAADVAKRKAEQESRAMQKTQPQPPYPPEMAFTPPEVKPEQQEREWVGFQVFVTVDEAAALGEYLRNHNIKFKPV